MLESGSWGHSVLQTLALVSLTLGQIDTDVEAVVVEINDNGLLGTDVLQNGDGDLLICCLVKESW